VAGLRYKPDGPVLLEFLKDRSFVSAIQGPVGSGKSGACTVKLLSLMLEQAPGPDGLRRSRWAVIRNTNPQLRTTTIKTWQDWLKPEDWGRFYWNPPPYRHEIARGDVRAEVIFLALDRPEDIAKLLSLELTGAWINEAREIPKSIVDAVTMRVGRYPALKDGGPSWFGVVMDTNPADADHWWPIMSGQVPVPEHFSTSEARLLVRPHNWRFFAQPGAMLEQKDARGEVTGYVPNPAGENLRHLTPDYYVNLIQGKAKSWIDVYVMGRVGTLAEGKPVFPTWTEAVHRARAPLPPVPGVPVIVGLDFGLTPAAAVCQLVRGRWFVLAELVAQDMGMTRFAPLLKRELAQLLPGWPDGLIRLYGDPAGDQRSQVDERTPYQILAAHGLKAYPAPSNDLAVRLGAVEGALARLVDGAPGLVVSPACATLCAGFGGGYQYRRLQVSGAERHEDQPLKNRFSHVMDALQYALLGGGEGRTVVGARGDAKPVQARVPFDPFSRRDRPARPEREARFRFR
jgi:hypothetical protein